MDHPDSPSPARRWLRRLAYTVVVLFALVFCFYAIENMRGRNAWHNTVAELEAKGEKIAWKDFIPAPIPDEQNMLKAPGMEEWFVKRGGTDPGWHDLDALRAESERLYGTSPIPVAYIRVVSSEDQVKPGPRSVLADLKIPDAAQISYPFTLPDYRPKISLLLTENKPGGADLPTIYRVSSTTLTVDDLYPSYDYDEKPKFSFRLEPTANEGVYRLDYVSSADSSPILMAASDYLSFIDKFAPDFVLLREANKRPHCRSPLALDSKAEDNFTSRSNMLALAKLIYLRSKACLILGQHEAALGELQDFSILLRISLMDPALVGGFFCHATFAKLQLEAFADIIASGKCSRDQLTVIQQQIGKNDFMKNCIQILRNERSFACHNIISLSAEDFARDYYYLGGNEKLRIIRPDHVWYDHLWYVGHASPRGWFYQNAANTALRCQPILEALENSPDLVAKVEASASNANSDYSESPYSALCQLPLNLGHFIKFAAHAQTTAHLGVLACALERYRLATGTLPETLDSLVPNYLSKVPRQVVHDQPFQYRLETDGGCTLWSDGWDLTDDGGYVWPRENFPKRHASDWGCRLPGRPKLGPK